MPRLLDELKRYGSIMITEEEDNAYLMFTKEIYPVMRILQDNDVTFESKYNSEFKNYEVDFQL